MDEHLHSLFKTNKIDLSDNGFSERVAASLPHKTWVFSQLLLMLCIAIGLGICVYMVGVHTILGNLATLIAYVCRLQMPPLSAVATYLIGMAVAAVVPWSVLNVRLAA
ncbi:hypothetical protein AGMMS4956_02920 [Bacteroidia bacterium]|nr:hypothetical protein AGMMS4956_02920 [Bacteroidia bacterium]